LYRTGPAAALVIGLALALASCGDGGSSEGGTTAAIAASGDETVKATGKDKPADSAAAVTGSPAGACQARLGEFLARMSDLRQSLLAGLSYEEYVVRVRAIRDAYEAVPVERLGATCVTGPAADAEDALNQYLRAANAWGECAATAGCAASEVEGELQHRWKLASKSLDSAKKES
jgi:hypothetical protein